MYGLFYALLAFFGILATYKDLGFGYSVTYLIPKLIKQQNYQKSWIVYKYAQFVEVGTSILLSFILIVLAPWLSTNYFKVPEAQNLIYIFCIYFIASSFLEALSKMFTGLQQEKNYSSIQFSRLFLALIFSLLFLFFDYSNIIYFALAWALAHIMSTIIYTYILGQNHNFVKKKLFWDKKLFTLMFQYAIPILITTSIYTFISFTDNFFLTLFRNVREVGIYNIIIPLVSIPIIFLSPINSLLFPLVSHLMEGEKEKTVPLLNAILRLIPFVGLYFSLFIILFPSTTVQLIFGVKWVGLVETPLKIMALGTILSLLSSSMTTVTCGMGKIRERMRASVIIAVFNIVLSIILIRTYGVTGAALASSLVYLLSVILFARIVKQEFNFNYPFKLYSFLTIFSVFLYSLIQLTGFTPHGLGQFISTGIFYSFIIAIFGLLLGIFDYFINIVVTTNNFAVLGGQYPKILVFLLRINKMVNRFSLKNW
jgi:O-antigen/teichoic acid export membrane protein